MRARDQGPARSLLTAVVAPLPRPAARSPPAVPPQRLLKFKVEAARAAQCEGVRPAHRSSALYSRYVSASRRSQPRELEPSSHRRESLTTRQSDYYRTFGLQCLCLCLTILT
ncbi:unnamed protein product [Danaus chrysippus]|uniref:(African queen) hypothetical protein n=1 Tax=Danaus chrysippus TaxID=151541 RepID=A0A8J2RBW6_9NEOP|nr:unnamed protein product [Danaus chrysippus]